MPAVPARPLLSRVPAVAGLLLVAAAFLPWYRSGDFPLTAWQASRAWVLAVLLGALAAERSVRAGGPRLAALALSGAGLGLALARLHDTTAGAVLGPTSEIPRVPVATAFFTASPDFFRPGPAYGAYVGVALLAVQVLALAALTIVRPRPPRDA